MWTRDEKWSAGMEKRKIVVGSALHLLDERHVVNRLFDHVHMWL